jgi:ribosomal-protein-alanine N-acetyltransferase
VQGLVERWSAEIAGVEIAGELASLAAGEIPNAWSARSFSDQLQRQGNSVWIVRRDSDLVGFLLLERVIDETTVLNIVVDRSSRREGVAREMLTRAIADASGSAVDVVHLEVRASNSAARALYESLGFRVVGKRPRYYERREDAILMSLRLE